MSKVIETCKKCGSKYEVEMSWAQYNWYMCPSRPMKLKELLHDLPKEKRDMLRLNLCKTCLNKRK